MIHNNKKTIVNSILLLTFVITAFIIGCGRMPPPEYWTWTKEDSTQIQTIVNEWKPKFVIAFEKSDSFYHVGYIADTVARNIRVAIRTLWTKPHYWPGAITRTFTSTISDSFIPTKDTTVLVRVREMISGVMKIKAESSTVRFGDTTISNETYPLYSRRFVKCGDTFNLIVRINANNDTVRIRGTNTDTLIENPFTGYCDRFMHFDYNRTNGTWQFTKMTGGSRIFIPSYNDAPYIQLCSLITQTKAFGILERPDTTTVQKYGIQRLYPVDSIISFSVNDTLSFRATNFIPRLVIGFVHNNQKRAPLTITNATTTPRSILPYPLEDANSNGWEQVMLEIAPWEALCRKGNYNAIIWVMPIRINP